MTKLAFSAASGVRRALRVLSVPLISLLFLYFLLVTLSHNHVAVAAHMPVAVPGTLPPQPKVLVTPTHAAISVVGVTPVKALVLASSGLPAKGEIVTFTVVPANGGEFDSQTKTTSLHDGIATVVFTASTTAQIVTITAESLGVLGSASISVEAKSPANIRMSSTPQTLPADGQSTAAITATVTDMYGNPTAGKNISFLATGGNILGADSNTDKNGNAAATFRAGTVASSAVVTAIVSQVQAGTVITLTAGQPRRIHLGLDRQTIRVGDSTTISVTVLDALTNSVPGVPVTLTASTGKLSAVPSLLVERSDKQLVVSTSPGGKAFALLTGVETGNAIVTATTSGVEESVVITVDEAMLLLPLILGPDNPLPSIINGAFAQGPNVGWASTWPTGPQDVIIVRCDGLNDSAVRSGCGGEYLAWLGGRRVPQEMYLSQAITSPLPSTYSAQLRYRFFTFSDRTSTCDLDYALITINGTETKRYNLCSSQDTNSWTSDSISLTDFRGKPIDLSFGIHLSGGALGNFFLDDITICGDPQHVASERACASAIANSIQQLPSASDDVTSTFLGVETRAVDQNSQLGD